MNGIVIFGMLSSLIGIGLKLGIGVLSIVALVYLSKALRIYIGEHQ